MQDHPKMPIKDKTNRGTILHAFSSIAMQSQLSYTYDIFNLQNYEFSQKIQKRFVFMAKRL